MSRGHLITGAKSTRARAKGNLVELRQKRKGYGMMLGIKRWIRDWLNEEDDFPDLVVQDVEHHSITKNGMNIKFFRAQGGFVLETRHYDSQQDENQYQLYIVTDDQDLGQEMSKILTVESMRNL